LRYYEVPRRDLQLLLRRSATELSPALLGGVEISDPITPAPGHCLVVCQEKPTLRVTALVTRESERSEFLAWIATYLSGYRPITAHFHVLTPELLKQLLNAKAAAIDPRTVSGLAGAILGEALLASPRDSAVITIGKCRSTQSFALSRGVVLGLGDAVRREMAEERWRWIAPRRSSSLNGSAEEMELPVLAATASPQLGLGFSMGPHGDLIRACVEIRSRGEISRELLQLLVSRLPVQFEGLYSAIEGTREVKVGVFEAFRGVIDSAASQMPSRGSTAAFLLGYLASRIAPGSLEHFRLVTMQGERYATAIIWYGLCAGLHPESEVLERSPVARRVVRDLLLRESLLDTPRGDIALFELDQMGAAPTFAPYLDGPLDVEVVPGVVCRSLQPSASQASDRDLSELAAELGTIVHRLGRIQQRMAVAPGRGKEPSGRIDRKTSGRRVKNRE